MAEWQLLTSSPFLYSVCGWWGEEFVYVLTGSIEVVVGEHVNKLGTGDSLHFNSGIQHHMRNIGETDAELIVIVYNP